MRWTAADAKGACLGALLHVCFDLGCVQVFELDEWPG